MPKRTIAEPLERMRKNWFSVPESLYLAVKVECARRGIPIRYALLSGLELFLKDSVAFKKFVRSEMESHPRIVQSRGPSYHMGVTRTELPSEEITPLSTKKGRK